MQIQEIITGAIDLAGGSIIREALDEHQATLLALNIIDTMTLELANSGKGLADLKETFTFAAGTNTGSMIISNFALNSMVLRYRSDPSNAWMILDSVADIEDLTRNENIWRRAIYLQGTDPLTYFLSWTPDTALTVEAWGKKRGSAITTLTASTGISVDFDRVAMYRLTDFVLNQLLLLDAKRYRDFVVVQKQSVAREAARNEHLWRVYRTSPVGVNDSHRAEEYDYRDDMSSSLRDWDFWG